MSGGFAHIIRSPSRLRVSCDSMVWANPLDVIQYPRSIYCYNNVYVLYNVKNLTFNSSTGWNTFHLFADFACLKYSLSIGATFSSINCFTLAYNSLARGFNPSTLTGIWPEIYMDSDAKNLSFHRASDFFQDWWAEVTHGAKLVGHFSEMMGPEGYQTNHSWHLGSILYPHTDTDTCMHICILTDAYTVKPVLSGHSKKKD